MDEIVILKDEIQLLLNTANKVSISYPLYPHFEILTAKAENEVIEFEGGYKFRLLVDKNDFEKESSKFNQFFNEMPTYNDILECMLSSNIIKYKNEAKFTEKMKHFRSMKKKTYFCPDTNIIYHRFISNYSNFKQNEIVLIDTVKEEIEACLNFKYNSYQISGLKTLIKYQNDLLDELINKRMKRSRLAAYIALQEYKKVKELAFKIEGIEKPTKDKEENDKIIVKSIKRFEKEKDALPILLTADIAMTDVCEIEDLEYFLFEIPIEANAEFCTSEQFLQLVYNLATVFGVIKLNSTLIFGEFKGKTKYETLKLKFLDEKVLKEIEKDLRICRKLMKLGIEK